jgi:hypothetical protein
MRGEYETEVSEAGIQALVPGVAPLSLRDRLNRLADAPLIPRKLQRPPDFGLFDINSRNQLELFNQKEQTP